MAEFLNERIRGNAAELRLHGIAESPDELIGRAEDENLGYREFLDLVLESEVGVLEGRRYAQRLKMAGLPHHKTLEEFGYLPLDRADANRPFQVVNRRYTKGSTIVTSNKAVGEWAQTFGDEVLAAAILDRLLHDAEVLSINGPSFRLKGRLEALSRQGDEHGEDGE